MRRSDIKLVAPLNPPLYEVPTSPTEEYQIFLTLVVRLYYWLLDSERVGNQSGTSMAPGGPPAHSHIQLLPGAPAVVEEASSHKCMYMHVCRAAGSCT
jgi:hypothetical protein